MRKRDIKTTVSYHPILIRMATTKKTNQGFTGLSVVKNLPANAGDMSFIPGQEDHTCHGETIEQLTIGDHAPQLLSLCSRTQELQLLKPVHPRAHVPQQRKPPEKEAQTQQLESSPCWPQLEKSPCRDEDPAQTNQPKTKQVSTGGCDETGTLVCHWWNCKMCSCQGKQYASSSKY